MRNKNQQKGFTLIELLVVIVILGILSTISVGTFRSYFAKARDSERVSTVQNLAMMMKVDSGGSGDCGVYNYQAASGTTQDASGVETGTCSNLGVLGSLLSNNDYAMPTSKNGLKYYYGFRLGETEGDNEFFIMIGAEEENPQNGKALASADAGDPYEFAFVDGTTEGITEVTANCNPDNTTGAPVCTANVWNVIEILDGGAFAGTPACTVSSNNTTLPCVCEGGATCSGANSYCQIGGTCTTP